MVVTTPRVVVVFVGLMLGSAMSSLDSTLVATASPTIVSDLHGLRDYAWLATAYLLTAMASTPLYGKLGDLYGRKRIFLVALGVFLVGSVLCGSAQSMGELVAFRALQGLGAGGLMAVPMAILADLVPARDLGRWIGYSGLVFAVSSVLGPLLGGVFSEYVSWRWAFFINVPIGAVTTAIIGRALQVPQRRTEHRIDYLGALLLVSAITCVVLATSWGGEREPWGSPLIVGLCAGAAVIVGVFWWHEHRVPEPIVPPRLLRLPVARIAMPLNLVTGILFYAGLYFVSAFVQFVDGVKPADAGFFVIPFMLGAVAGTIIAGRGVDRTGRYKAYPILGALVSLVGVLLLVDLGVHSRERSVLVAATVLGLGIGLAMQTVLLALQNAVHARDMGVATSTTFLMRQLGGALGLAILGSILTTQLKHWLPRLTPASAHLDVTTLRGSAASIGTMAPRVQDGVVEAFARALHAVFLWLLPALVVFGALAVLLPQLPLRMSVEHTAAEDLALAFEEVE